MSVLDLPSAKIFLNIDVTTYDAELQVFIDAAEAAIAQQVGPLSGSSTTDRVPGWGWSLHLPTYPVLTLTSVTPVGGTALTLANLHLNKQSGAVSYNTLTFFNSDQYDVVYTPGRSPVPADLLMAVKRRLRYDWRTQRGSGARPGTGSGDDDLLAVKGLIEPYLLFTVGA